jgi:hypothetical protein
MNQDQNNPLPTTTEESTTIKAKKALKYAAAGNWDKANEIMEGYGIETVSMQDRELKYVNMGETYALTVCQEIQPIPCTPFIGSWGEWFEAAEEDHCVEEGVIRCGYCGEFTELNKENWHDVVCQTCGKKVDGSI